MIYRRGSTFGVAAFRAVYLSSHFPESLAGFVTCKGAGFAWQPL